MNAIDSILDGDETVVLQIIDNAGPLAAAQFVSRFNNACMQTAGFEDAMAILNQSTACFLVPLYNFSTMVH